MPNPSIPSPHFESLSWDDLVTWAGSKVASRGRGYQREGRVKNLAVTVGGGLVASVDGSERYAVQVRMDWDGTLESYCTCPYTFDCKHGVAAVLEYLAQVAKDRSIPRADPQDPRLAWTSDDAADGLDEDGDPDKAHWTALSPDVQAQVDALLGEKTKTELIDLIHGFMEKYPEVASELQDAVQLNSGDITAFTARLRREIRQVGSEPGWQHHWDDEGFTPDYSGILSKLEALLAVGRADEVLALGKELIESGVSQLEMSDDMGETAVEISSCVVVLPRALAVSSLPEAERLLWAMDLLFDDPFDLCDDLAGYLKEDHSKSAWNAVADELLKRLAAGNVQKNDFSQTSTRDQISHWAIHALEQAGREQEILPLCEVEADKTDSYDRLVSRLISLGRYEDAEHWIGKGIRATDKERPGIASQLREELLTIRTCQQDWSGVTSLRVEEFVRRPSVRAFEDCREPATRFDAWPTIRQVLLAYLVNGQLPWKQAEWTLPKPSADAPKFERRDAFPRVSLLIELAIAEGKPEEVLHWYDQRPKSHGFGFGSLDDAVATAVQSHAPDRALSIWKGLAEREIARVKPSAYHDAAGYLRKAAKVMIREKKEAEWTQYLVGLRKAHFRKTRLLEVLDTLSAKPIINSKR